VLLLYDLHLALQCSTMFTQPWDIGGFTRPNAVRFKGL